MSVRRSLSVVASLPLLAGLVCSAALALAGDAAGDLKSLTTPDGAALGPPPAGLHVEVRGDVAPRAYEPGTWPELRAFLVNRSEHETRRVVRPGDGSESGMREPYVFWTLAYVAADGSEELVPERPLMRCGNFDSNWHDDVVTLAPAAELALDPSPLPLAFLAQRSGTLRLRAHYAWRARPPRTEALATAPMPKGLGSMAGIAAYEVVSAPTEMRIARLLEPRLALRGDARVAAGATHRVRDLFGVSVENLGTAPRTLDARVWGVFLEFENSTTAWAEYVEGTLQQEPVDVTLAAGARRELLGARADVPCYPESVRFTGRGTVRVTAHLRHLAGPGEPDYASDAVELRVDE